MTKAVAKGYKWVAYQWNDENLGPQQQALCDATRTACTGKLKFTVWLTRPFDGASARQAAVDSQAQGIILEGEIPSEWKNPSTGQVEPKPDAVNWPDVIFHLSGLNIPQAVVTNFAPFVHQDGSPWPEKAKPLVDAGWHCITENFITETPTATPARTNFYATHNLGWSETQPMVEAWHLQDYGDLSGYRNVSHWDASSALV